VIIMLHTRKYACNLGGAAVWHNYYPHPALIILSLVFEGHTHMRDMRDVLGRMISDNKCLHARSTQ
jgi:hypothetical protein